MFDGVRLPAGQSRGCTPASKTSHPCAQPEATRASRNAKTFGRRLPYATRLTCGDAPLTQPCPSTFADGDEDYGVAHNAAVAAVLLYEAVGLIVPLDGGGIAYLFLRRTFGSMQTSRDAVGPA